MRIVIIGGHGKIALLATPNLVADGHRVTSVIRNAAHSDDVVAAGATPLVADVEALDADGIGDVISDHDAVVWSAGAGGGDPARTRAVDRDAAIRSIDAAVTTGVRRYVMVSYFGAGPDHGVPPDSSFFAYAEAKAAADAHLRASGLDWTILGPSALTDDPGTGLIELGGTHRTDGGSTDGGSADITGSSVPRADVAAVVASVIGRPGTAGLTIEFNAGSEPIDAALDELVAGNT